MRKTIGLFLAFGLIFLAGCNNSNNTTSNIDTGILAKCLTEKGAIMYGTDTCPYCLKQKELFGDNFQYINFIDCSQYPQTCSDAGVTGVPFWEMGAENKLEGFQSLEVLAEAAGC